MHGKEDAQKMRDKKEVGKIIAELRREKGLRQKDLSKILNMSPSNISNYESGAYWPDMNTICKMADYFNVTTDYLLGRTSYRCPPEILDQYAASDYAIHNIVNTLLYLDSGSLDAVIKYVNYLKTQNLQKTK
jgi:transcriptional regulator with XRE-family HTH domain